MAIVYIHRRNDSGEIFYVGIGMDKYRMGKKSNRNTWWHRIVKKHGYTKELIISNISWEQAVQLEILLISQYGRRDQGMGNLVNLTDGGEGINGISDAHRKAISKPATEETKARLKEVWRKKKEAGTQYIVTEEHKEAVMKAQAEKVYTKEYREKLTQSAIGRVHPQSSKDAQRESITEMHQLKKWYGKEIWRQYQALPIDPYKRNQRIRRLSKA